MKSEKHPIRDVRITAVQNGFIVLPRDVAYRDGGYSPDCYVFSTVEQMAAWMLKQAWDTPEGGCGG
jgi:hypothetical protein